MFYGFFGHPMQIYINRDGQQFGPFTLDQVNQGLATGQLLPNDFAFYEGLQQWTPLDQIQGVVILGSAPLAAPAPIQAEIVASPVTEDEEPAIVATAGVDGASKKKRIIMIAGISVGSIAVICVLLFVYPGFMKSPEIPDVKTVKAIIPPPDQSSEPAIQLPDISGVGPVSYFRDIKIIFEEKFGELLGCHIIGTEATELIAELAMAKGLEATWQDLARTVHAHPTLSEAVMEAALDAFGEAIHQ